MQQQSKNSSISRTLSTLDTLLGIEEEERKKKEEEEKKAAAAAASATDTSVSPEAMQKLADADAQRAGAGGGDDLDGQFAKIVEKAKKLANSQQASEAEQAQLKREFDGLLQKINKPPEAMSKEDIKRLKDAAFGPQTFWVTETQPITDLERTGLLIRGNLRDERSKVYEHVCKKVGRGSPPASPSAGMLPCA